MEIIDKKNLKCIDRSLDRISGMLTIRNNKLNNILNILSCAPGNPGNQFDYQWINYNDNWAPSISFELNQVNLGEFVDSVRIQATNPYEAITKIIEGLPSLKQKVSINGAINNFYFGYQ